MMTVHFSQQRQHPDFGVGNLLAIFRENFIGNTLQQPLCPKYKKTGASSLIRLGFHKSLVGGIASRPILPDFNTVLETIKAYSSLPNQSYPHHVRLDMPIIHHPSPLPPEYEEIPFHKRSGLYQRIKKCIRAKHSIAEIVFEN